MSRKQKISFLCPLSEQIQTACLEISLSVASLGLGLMALGLKCGPQLWLWWGKPWEEGRESCWCPQDSEDSGTEGKNMGKWMAKVL